MTLAGLARRRKKHGPLEALTCVEISQGFGLKGDARGKPGRRQVTVLSLQSWQKASKDCWTKGGNTDRDQAKTISWLIRRANLLLDGYEFSAADVGKSLHIGSVILQITREADPCERMEQQQTGLFDALLPDWRGGVCCQVLQGGLVSVGESIEINAAVGQC